MRVKNVQPLDEPPDSLVKRIVCVNIVFGEYIGERVDPRFQLQFAPWRHVVPLTDSHTWRLRLSTSFTPCFRLELGHDVFGIEPSGPFKHCMSSAGEPVRCDCASGCPLWLLFRMPSICGRASGGVLACSFGRSLA